MIDLPSVGSQRALLAPTGEPHDYSSAKLCYLGLCKATTHIEFGNDVLESCVTYYFAYVNKKPILGENLRSIADQVEKCGLFGRSRCIRASKQFTSILTNRNRHFADTFEFREAVNFAKQNGLPILIADLQSLLNATAPDEILKALSNVATCGVPVLNASSGGMLKVEDFGVMAHMASAISTRRRTPIKSALKGLSATDRPSTPNQAKAARGAALTAQRNAEKLRPIVESLVAGLNEGAPLTPTVLMRELNARSIPTPLGRSWHASSARNLLRRLGLN